MPPRFSIIVPTRNRADSLERCLNAISQLDNQHSCFEVLVVDDGSTPPASDVLARYASLLPLYSFRTQGVGPASARNLALHHATGDYVVFTDDDCRPHPQWLNAFANAEQKLPGAGFGGSIVDSPENCIYGRTSQMIVSFLYQYAERSKHPPFFCSNNLAFPRAALIQLGGFDESFPHAAAEDRDLCARWLQHGPLHFVPEAIVEHQQQLNLRSFLRQHYRYGAGAFHYWQCRKSEGGSENKLEAWPFYRGLISCPYGKMGWAKSLIMSTLIVASQAMVMLGYYAERFADATHPVTSKRSAVKEEARR